MSLKRRISRLNDLLRQELGSFAPTQGQFTWQYSEDLWRDMVVADARGQIRYVALCECGEGVSVHKASCDWSSMVPRIERRKLCRELNRQWVVCRLFSPGPREEWDRMFCGRSTYPENGYYVPISYSGPVEEGTPRKYIALDPDIEPNEAITRAFIEGMKRELTKRTSQRIAEIEAAQAYEDKQRDGYVQDLVDEALGPFPNSIPGKRGGSVSLPDPHLQATY